MVTLEKSFPGGRLDPGGAALNTSLVACSVPKPRCIVWRLICFRGYLRACRTHLDAGPEPAIERRLESLLDLRPYDRDQEGGLTVEELVD